MALKQCRECGQEVSSSAKKCPHCGVSNPAGGLAGLGCAGQGCLGVIVLMVMVGLFGIGDDGGTSSSSSEYTPPSSSSSPTTHVRRYAHRTINVRAGPGTDHGVVDQLNAGDMAYVQRRTNDWTVLYAGPSSSDTVGFVLGELLESGPPPDLQVISTQWENGEYGNDYATGRIRNNTSSTYSYVQIEINVYDANGNQIGSTLDNVNNLEPGGTWQFRAIITDDQARRFRIKDVSGY